MARTLRLRMWLPFCFFLLAHVLLGSMNALPATEDHDLVWFVQLSDLHISKHHPERAADLKAKVAPALAIIQPNVVLITGDLTEARSATRYPTRQDEWEWYEYNTVMSSLSKTSGVPIDSFVDIRGNHDTFGVGLRGGPGDFFPKYGAIGGRSNRSAGALQRVFTVDLQATDGPKHVLVGIDAAQEVGLRGPCNFFGMPSDALLDSLDSTLEHVNRAPTGRAPTVVAFGHFTLSFMAKSESGRRVEDVLKKHGVSAYLCGHLHARFGGLLHKFHRGLASTMEVHQEEGPDWINGLDADDEEGESSDGLRRRVRRRALSERKPNPGGFWEWESGDWKESRFMRLVAIRRGQVSFSDVQFSSRASEDTGHVATAEYRRSVGLGRLVENEGTTHDSQLYDEDSALILLLSPSNGHYRTSLGVDSIEALVFSKHELLDVSAQIWDRGGGFSSKGSIAEEVKLEGVSGRDRPVLYARKWDPSRYASRQIGRYWIQIVVRDSTGQKLASRQTPFVIGDAAAVGGSKKGVRVPLFKQSLASYLLIGVRWEDWYVPALVGAYVLLLGCLLVLPRFYASYLQSKNRFEDWTHRALSRPLRVGWNPLVVVSRVLEIVCWALCESATHTPVWLPQVIYLSYLAVGPWFLGQALDDASAPLASFYLRYWSVHLPKTKAWLTAPMPCTLILALPFFLLVLFPWMLWIAAFTAYREAAKRPGLKATMSMQPRRDLEHQLEPRNSGESSLLPRTESASNLARGAIAQRRRALSKTALKERDEEEPGPVQTAGFRTGPRGLETLGWTIKAAGGLLGVWTLLHSSFAGRAYGATVLISPYLLGLLGLVLFAVFSQREAVPSR